MLIVCEGKKTEPNYLFGLRKAHRLSSANIKIVPADGTDPLSIVRYAQQQMARERYDKVYCVFDRDGHSTYDAALAEIAQSEDGKAERLVAITSWPCFEVWLLLHFVYSAAPFTAGGGKSSGQKVLAALLKEMPSYTKGALDVYAELEARLETAFKHAYRLEKDNAESKSTNPHTKMHTLVDELIKLKK